MYSINHIIFCHSAIGGAYLVASNRAAKLGRSVQLLKTIPLNVFVSHLVSSSATNFEFHQPGSFIYALFCVLTMGPKNTCVWLHECSYYSLRLSVPLSLLSSIARLLSVWAIYLLGAQLVSVSSYVKKSYFLSGPRVTSITNAGFLCLPTITIPSSQDGTYESIHNGVAIVFIRPFANCSTTINKFTTNAANLGVKKIFVVGTHSALPSLSAVNLPVDYLGIVQRQSFLDLLLTSFIFVTPFKREGLGLSTLEAMLRGNVIIAPRCGSYVEYIPHVNHQFLSDCGKVLPDITHQLVSAISENYIVANQYLS
jgi:hypothetical protein